MSIRAAFVTSTVAMAMTIGAATQAFAEDLPQPELDSQTINLPTHKTIPPMTIEIRFTHRFAQGVDDGGFDDLYGLDSSADIGIGVGIGLTEKLQVELYRSSLFKIWEGAVRINLARQGKDGGFPVGIGLRLGGGYRSAEGATEKWTGFAQLPIGRRFGSTDIFLVPMFASDTPSLTNAFNLGFALSWHATKSLDLELELTPANDDARPLGADDAEMQWAVGLNKRMGGHNFLLYLGNSRATTTDLLVGTDLPGGYEADDVRLGFNLTRQF